MDFDLEEVERHFGTLFHTYLWNWVKKHPVVVEMLWRPDMNPKQIMDGFFKAYPKPSSLDSTQMGQYLESHLHGILCLAVINNRVDLIRYNQEYLGDLNNHDYSLLVLAAYYGNRHLIRMLIAAGYHAEKKFNLSYDFDSFTFQTINALDMALYADNVEVLDFLCSSFVCSYMRVLCSLQSAITYHAESCFRFLLINVKLKAGSLSRLYLQSVAEDVHILKMLIKYGYRDFNSSREDGQTAMHLAMSRIIRNPESCNYVVEFLISLGVKTYSFNGQGELPIDVALKNFHPISSEYEPQFLMLSTIVSSLLPAMKTERPDQALTLHRPTIVNIQRNFAEQFTSVLDDIRWAKPRRNHCLDGWVNLLQECLSKGVNLATVDQEINEAKQADYRFSLFPRINSDFDTKYPFTLQQSHHFLKSMERFYTLLIVYGAKLDASCFKFLASLLKFRVFNNMTGFAKDCISLMSASDIQAFEKFVARQNMEDGNKIDISRVSNGFCKTLVELCRSTLYDNIRHRRMIAHVGSLGLPQLVQDYLIFDCKLVD